MARVGGGDWEITAVAPSFFHGDLREIAVENYPDELCRLETVRALLSRRIHVFVYARRLRELLQRDWDLVHCWEEPYIFAGGQIAWWTPRRVPLVFWTGQSTFKRYPPPFAQIERYCLSRCAGWMARGDSGEAALLRRGYACKPHRVMPLGVDLSRFRPDPSSRAQVHAQLDWKAEGPPIVGYLGRFVDEKGLPLLMRTLDRVNTPWRALFVGGGPLEPALRTWAETHSGRVRIVTGVAHDGVPAYLNAMDLLCAPSRTTLRWREIFGRMIIEAFACGVPVLASDCGEIPNVVRDAGVVVAEHDEPEWLGALDHLLRDSSFRAELARRGLERARAQYSWPVIARRHLDFFTEILEGAPGGQCRMKVEANAQRLAAARAKLT